MSTFHSHTFLSLFAQIIDVVGKNDSQNKVFTHGLTLGQKQELLKRKRKSLWRKKGIIWRICILIESKGEFSNTQMEQNNKEG